MRINYKKTFNKVLLCNNFIYFSIQLDYLQLLILHSSLIVCIFSAYF